MSGVESGAQLPGVQGHAERGAPLVVAQWTPAQQLVDTGQPVVQRLPANAESAGRLRLGQSVPEVRIEGAQQLGAMGGVVVEEWAELLTEEDGQLRPALKLRQ